jgi:predicted transcriptional regulator
MKKSRTLYIEFRSLDDLGKDLLEVFKTRVPKVQPKEVVYFDTLPSFRNFMTLQKLEILAMITAAEPKSIYELAQLLDRGLAAVQKDCELLELSRFIKFERKKGGRGSIKPKLAFDYDRIVVKRPDHPYSLKFEAA